MQRWEYKRLFMYVSNDGKYYMKASGETLNGKKILDHLNLLGNDGWEIITIVQKIGNEIFYDLEKDKKADKSAGEILGNLFTGMVSGPVVTPSTQHKTATVGYWFWLKKPKE